MRKISYFIILTEVVILFLYFVWNISRIMPDAEYNSRYLITAGEDEEGLKIDEGNGGLEGTDGRQNKRIVSPDTELKGEFIRLMYFIILKYLREALQESMHMLCRIRSRHGYILKQLCLLIVPSMSVGGFMSKRIILV